jgi:hypothetical protein
MGGMILIIAIQTGDVLPARFSYAAVAGRRDSSVRPWNIMNPGRLCAPRSNHLSRLVCAPIVNDEEFPSGQGLGHHGGNAPGQEMRPLKGGQNHRDQGEGVYGIDISLHASLPYRRVGAFVNFHTLPKKAVGRESLPKRLQTRCLRICS